MDTTERQVIDELFGKVRQAEAQSGPRDAAAEAYIAEHVKRQPAAPYYMAQAIVIQEQALAAAHARIEDLEQQVRSRPAGGGFLSSLFGGGPATAHRRPMHAAGTAVDPRIAPYMQPNARQPAGGGFLGGAMQTALGVAGGVLLGSALMSLFAPDAAAAEPAVPEEPTAEDFGGGFDGEF